jgi:hypothetical protein
MVCFLLAAGKYHLAYEILKYTQFISLITDYCDLYTVQTNINLVFVHAIDSKSKCTEYRL